MNATFDPYHQWLGIAPAEQPANHYRLLGVGQFEADSDVLQHAADQRMAHLRTFQSGPRGQLSQRLLNEIATALRCLLTPDLRARYDDELRRERRLIQAPSESLVGVTPVEQHKGVALASLPHCATMPPPVPPPPTAVRAMGEQASTVQVSGPSVRTRRGQSSDAFFAVAKIIAGGVAGLAIGVLFLWGVVGVDPFGLFGKQATISRQPVDQGSTSLPLATPISAATLDLPQPSEPTSPPPAVPVSVTEPTSEAPEPVVPLTEPLTVPSLEPQPPPSVLADSPVFLSDLQPIQVVALRVPPARVRVREQQSPHGIFLHPSSNSTAKITFDLGRKFRSLTGSAALNDSANGPPLSPLTMRIVGDGQTLWTSKPIRSLGAADQFQIDITGIATLELEVQCPGADGRAHAAWFAVMADPAADPTNEELEKLFPSGKPKPRELSDLLKPKAEPATSKLPRPTPDKLAAAEKTFAEVMGAEITGAKTLEAKSKLADKLLQLGAAPGQDAAGQFVVLSAACTKAVEFDQLLKGLALLEQRFAGDLTDVRLQGFEAVKGQINLQQIEKFGDTLLASIESAERTDRFGAADDLCKIGQAVGRKLNDRRFTDAFAERSARTDKLANAFSLVKPSLLTAQANPDDQEAAMRSGQYIAYVRNDWKAALPMLARTTDEELQALVQDDLKNPKEDSEILKLADRWWERAESSSALSQEGMRRRATHWYRVIPQGKLQGLEAQKVAKRIAETETDWLASWRPFSPKVVFEKKAIGRYRLYITNLGNKERKRQGLVTIAQDYVVIGQDGKPFGHWRQDGEQLRLDFTAHFDGYALLQTRTRQWAGHHHRPSDKTVWGWELIPE